MRHRHPNRRFPHNQTCQRPRLHNQFLFPWNTPWSTPSTWMRPALTKTAAWLHTFAKAFVKTPIDGWKITAVDRCGGPQGWQATQNASAQEWKPTLKVHGVRQIRTQYVHRQLTPCRRLRTPSPTMRKLRIQRVRERCGFRGYRHDDEHGVRWSQRDYLPPEGLRAWYADQSEQ